MIPTGPLPRAVILLAVLVALPELVLQAADHGLVGTQRWRRISYGYGAFWADLLCDGQPRFTGQSVAMFFSYSFLHTGLWHLLGNLIGLFWLGTIAARRAGPKGFALICLCGAVGGGVFHGILAPGPAPMVGVSAALFGLAGAYGVWFCQPEPEPEPEANAARRQAGGLREALRFGGVLLAANLLHLIVTQGHAAWQAHLGGFVSGVAITLAIGLGGALRQR